MRVRYNVYLQVRYWITHNEPWVISYILYGDDSGRGAENCYLAAHNLNKAHAKIYHLYRNQYKDKQQGDFFSNKWYALLPFDNV